MEALFTSLLGGEALRRSIRDLIGEAAAAAHSGRVDIHIMTFSFTDAEIADALADAALRHPSLTVRILADWSQRIRARGQQVADLAARNIPNLIVRYSNDQPYVWDASAGHMRWSYHASRGLLHHKVLIVLIDGRPWRLLCGSFNWTATAARSYENLLIVPSDEPGSREIIGRMELEFEALWSDGGATLSPSEAELHYQAILDAYRRDPSLHPAQIAGLGQGQGDMLKTLEPGLYPPAGAGTGAEHAITISSPDARTAIAFSARARQGGRREGGHAEHNRAQRLCVRRKSGRVALAPLTITALALDVISRAAPGDTLKVAMYGLSPRIPEYGALLDAAGRGVRLQVLLDRGTGGSMAARLADRQRGGALPIEIRTAGRMMHQKYIVNARTGEVVTGTANMSTDASARHLEHRIRISGWPALAGQFCADFDLIWSRLSRLRAA
jgi:phosphatidylserine/phosphatidylglycerophosphate/cardiolipin synthase-like enzyme